MYSSVCGVYGVRVGMEVCVCVWCVHVVRGRHLCVECVACLHVICISVWCLLCVYVSLCVVCRCVVCGMSICDMCLGCLLCVYVSVYVCAVSVCVFMCVCLRVCAPQPRSRCRGPICSRPSRSLSPRAPRPTSEPPGPALPVSGPQVGDAIQPSRPVTPSPPPFNLSQHQGLFQ